jgi:3-oxoacyl-[acyl-carrier protein] reductase
MGQGPLDGKVAIVTGAGRGIGSVLALALAEHDAHVMLAARTEPELVALRDEIRARGGSAACLPTDVTREADIAALVRETVVQFGRLDIVVNNAGIGLSQPLVDTTTEAWDRIMAVNARGPFLLCRDAIPHLKRQPISYIINIVSVVGVKGYINQAAYSASKHALLGMSKALAKEVQGDGIRVHAVLPGGVDTEVAAQMRPDLDRSILIKPQDVADIVMFLVTRQGNAVIDEIQVRRASATPWA